MLLRSKLPLSLGRKPGNTCAPDGAGAPAIRTPPWRLVVSMLDHPGAAHRLTDDLEGADLPGVVGPMLEALHSPSPMVRAQAAEVLGMTEDPASAGPLTEALTDPDPQVRFAALLALGQLDSPSAREAIASQTDADDVRVRLLARRLAGS